MGSWEEGPSGGGTFSKIKTLLADKRLVGAAVGKLDQVMC